MALEMKFFVLKPKAKSRNDLFAEASVRAMLAYATTIETVDVELADGLREWASRERLKRLELRD